MKTKKLGTRGFILKYDDGDTNYLINGKNTIYLCDTHMGPKSMALVKDFIKRQGWQHKELVIFNTHSHYDHIWGNCAFENELIIAHELCRKRIEERGFYDLERLQNFYDTEGISIRLPNITFKRKLEFHEDDIVFIHTPGHTDCSAICIDKRDSVIYVNDLLEDPLPHLAYEDWSSYVKTLEFIKGLSPKIMLTTHSGIVDEELLDQNILYIKDLLKGEVVTFEDEIRLKVHNSNIKRRLTIKNEKEVKQALGDKFDYKAYKIAFWSLLGIAYSELEGEYAITASTPYEVLEAACKVYIDQIG